MDNPIKALEQLLNKVNTAPKLLEWKTNKSIKVRAEEPHRILDTEQKVTFDLNNMRVKFEIPDGNRWQAELQRRPAFGPMFKED